MKIYVKECSSCEFLQNVLKVVRTNQGSLIKYEPNIPHQPWYTYEWHFGSSVFNTREVFRNSMESGYLKLYDISSDDCCEVAVKFSKDTRTQIEEPSKQRERNPAP